MKHWLFYIRIAKQDIREVPLLMSILGENNVYARRPIYGNCREDLHPGALDIQLSESDDGEYLYGLYAWTDDKELSKMFNASRNPKYFTCRKMDIPTDVIEWEALRSHYKSHELMRMGYSNDEGVTFSIPMTHFESDFILDNESEVIDCIIRDFSEHRESVWKDTDFVMVLDILDGDLNKSLETFGWSFLVVECGFADCELYMSGCRGDDADYLVDLYYNLSSYGKGITGYDMQPYELDPVNTYIFMLGDLLE